MNSLPLVVSALAMGMGGSLHCIAMCGALQRSATGAHVLRAGGAADAGGSRGDRRGSRAAWFQAGRILGYATLGAAAGFSGQWLLDAARWQPMFQSTWAALNALLLILGISMLALGRQPDWLDRIGAAAWQRVRPVTRPIVFSRPGAGEACVPLPGAGGGFAAPSVRAPVASRPSGPSRTALVMRGAAWAMLPCGLLYSALAMALLASDPLHAALVMTAFAAGTTTGLVLFQSLMSRLPALAGRGSAGVLANPASADRLAFRLNGALLATMAGVALVAAIGGHANPFCAT
ncbi:MAG: sulfite exporter TauE/SafE family protein [Lautropia sp.]